ncbi:rhodanese-like domain-containing protein [Kineococcus sp. NPDC059986]|uniref:rhodanese-like domain-containing protein n=1 Tax=Kineococcus sp. NPDC059986 TaxID=3155538 RepID=UPI00344BC536
MGAADHLARVQAELDRLTPAELAREQAAGALVVDTRTPSHRAEQGEFPGALVIDRTVLEWRLDPAWPHRIPEATSLDLRVVVVCRHGYSSSLAAASLRAVGLHRATDLVGGVERWIADGYPVHRGTVDLRE